MQLNDSIYVVSYFEYDDKLSKLRNEKIKPKLFILTYNVNKSEKPIGKLVLYSYDKGMSELWSRIDSNFNIETNHHLSWNTIKNYMIFLSVLLSKNIV